MRYLFAPLLLALHSTAAPAPVVLEGRAANPSVTIASGVVVGTATGVANLPKVTGLANAYLGIPFAQSPPVRFAPPTEPQAWKTPLEAHTQPAACLQQFGMIFHHELTPRCISVLTRWVSERDHGRP